MNILKPLSGLLLLFIGIQAQSQADLDDFLSGQVVGNEVFMEYDYQAMLDSIDVLNAGTSSSSTPASTPWGVYTLISADIDGEAAFDYSGYSVSLSSDGTTVAIGAHYNDGNGSNSGHVRIYAWNSTTSAWEQQGADIDGEAAGDKSGYSVSLSSDGTTVAIGATGNDGNGSNSGHVRIYAWNSTTSAWEQQGADIDGEAEDENSGWSVSLSSDGTTVAIGAIENDGNGSNSGHVRIYAWNSTTSAWEQQGADIDGEAESDGSGWSVSLSSDGTTVAIGALSNDGSNGSNSGHVRIYAWNSTISAWEQQGADIDGEAENDLSGRSVSLSSDGTTVAIGAYKNDSNGSSSGHVRIHAWNSTTSAWEQQGADIDGEAAGDKSGYSVSLSSDGTTVAIGATGNDGNGSNSGHVRIYAWNSTTSAWEQQGADIDGEAEDENSGWSVSLSSDGTTVAIGAIENDGNGSNSGHVRIYAWNSTTSAWEQQGADIDGEAENDLSGWSVSFSSDGTTVAIGARFNEGSNGPSSGHVRIYSWN